MEPAETENAVCRKESDESDRSDKLVIAHQTKPLL